MSRDKYFEKAKITLVEYKKFKELIITLERGMAAVCVFFIFCVCVCIVFVVCSFVECCELKFFVLFSMSVFFLDFFKSEEKIGFLVKQLITT